MATAATYIGWSWLILVRMTTGCAHTCHMTLTSVWPRYRGQQEIWWVKLFYSLWKSEFYLLLHCMHGKDGEISLGPMQDLPYLYTYLMYDSWALDKDLWQQLLWTGRFSFCPVPSKWTLSLLWQSLHLLWSIHWFCCLPCIPRCILLLAFLHGIRVVSNGVLWCPCQHVSLQGHLEHQGLHKMWREMENVVTVWARCGFVNFVIVREETGLPTMHCIKWDILYRWSWVSLQVLDQITFLTTRLTSTFLRFWYQ